MMNGKNKYLKGNGYFFKFDEKHLHYRLAVLVTVTHTLDRAETGRALGLVGHHLSEKELAPGLVAEAASRELGRG